MSANKCSSDKEKSSASNSKELISSKKCEEDGVKDCLHIYIKSSCQNVRISGSSSSDELTTTSSTYCKEGEIFESKST